MIFSVHWGGNWGYSVPEEQIDFARSLIDSGAVDIVHGHSSHHVRPLEVYNGKLIVYGAGDFLNDYEGIEGNEFYRDDLALMYFPTLDSRTGQLVRLRMIPLQIFRFSLRRASADDGMWLSKVLTRESRQFGTKVNYDNGELELELPRIPATRSQIGEDRSEGSQKSTLRLVDLERDVVAGYDDFVGPDVSHGGRSQGPASGQIKFRPMPWAHNAAVAHHTFGESTAIVRTIVVDGMNQSLHVEHRDGSASHLDPSCAATGEVLRRCDLVERHIRLREIIRRCMKPRKRVLRTQHRLPSFDSPINNVCCQSETVGARDLRFPLLRPRAKVTLTEDRPYACAQVGNCEACWRHNAQPLQTTRNSGLIVRDGNGNHRHSLGKRLERRVQSGMSNSHSSASQQLQLRGKSHDNRCTRKSNFKPLIAASQGQDKLRVKFSTG